MSKPFSRKFYNTNAWKKCVKSYKASVYGLCEKCGAIGEEVHHIIPLTPDNINNPDITLNPDNLMLLCRSCHELIEEKARATIDGIRFTKDGQLIEVPDETTNTYN